MELILRSDSKDKIAKVLALASKLGITVLQRERADTNPRPFLPKGKEVSARELLDFFGKAPDFPSEEEIRAKAWPSSW